MFVSCLESTLRLGRAALCAAGLATAVAAHAVDVGQPAPAVKLAGVQGTAGFVGDSCAIDVVTRV